MPQRGTTTRPRPQYESWEQYVRTFVDPSERQVDIAKRTGLDQTTVSRWLNGGERSVITSQSVSKFARAYGRPVLEAFVVAGFLTSEEAGITFSDYVDLSAVPDRDLLAELQRRMSPHSDEPAHKPRRRVYRRDPVSG